MFARSPAANAAVATALCVGLYAVTVVFALDLPTNPWVICAVLAVAYIAGILLLARVVGFNDEVQNLPELPRSLLKPVNTYTITRPRPRSAWWRSLVD